MRPYKRIVLLHDAGIFGGAGMAIRRQAQSFLLNGCDVAVVAWYDNPYPTSLPLMGRSFTGNWLGVHSLQEVHRNNGLDDETIASLVARKVESFHPDMVIVGNLHWANWPLLILDRLRSSGMKIVAYAHDCYYVTGRCTYTHGCPKFSSGCDENCPTPQEAPALDPSKILDAWEYRRTLFEGPSGIPIAVNSNWMCDLVKRGFGGAATVDVVHLGLDEKLFAPIERRLSRRLLDIAQGKHVVLIGAVEIMDPRKGWQTMQPILESLKARQDVVVTAFGYKTPQLEGIRPFGVVLDKRRLPIIYSAADVFLNLPKEESFGMTMMEASACGTPIVASGVDGVTDIARNNENAIVLRPGNAEAALAAVEKLLRAPEMALQLGKKGRQLVEKEFTLEAQFQRWDQFLMKMFEW